MRAKSFFYASLSILALAVAYSLSVRTAQGQGAAVEAVAFDCGSDGQTYVSCAIGRHCVSGNPSNFVLSVSPDVPGTSPIISTERSINGVVYAALASGDVYRCVGGGDWIFLGNLVSTPTPVVLKSWGQVKRDHAAPAAPTSR
jgi:hypothetical protein